MPANDNVLIKFTPQHCLVMMHDSVLMFDNVHECDDFMKDYWSRLSSPQCHLLAQN